MDASYTCCASCTCLLSCHTLCSACCCCFPYSLISSLVVQLHTKCENICYIHFFRRELLGKTDGLIQRRCVPQRISWMGNRRMERATSCGRKRVDVDCTDDSRIQKREAAFITVSFFSGGAGNFFPNANEITIVDSPLFPHCLFHVSITRTHRCMHSKQSFLFSTDKWR